MRKEKIKEPVGSGRGGGGGVGVSHSHTAEEKPRLQIQEDQVLSLLFYEEERVAEITQAQRFL